MSDREDMARLADRLHAQYEKRELPSWSDIYDAARALRSAARNGPDVANQLWSALKDVCAANPDKSVVKKLVLVSEDDVRAAIAALAPAGKRVTVEEIARALEQIIIRRVFNDRVDGYTLEMSIEQATDLLSTYTITRKSKSEERS